MWNMDSLKTHICSQHIGKSTNWKMAKYYKYIKINVFPCLLKD